MWNANFKTETEIGDVAVERTCQLIEKYQCDSLLENQKRKCPKETSVKINLWFIVKKQNGHFNFN